jgi:hypothetical protein
MGTSAASTVKAAEVAEPFGEAIWIAPVVAPVGTTALICVALATVNEKAARPLNATEVVPRKFEPVRLTAVPGLPCEGLTALMAGAVLGVGLGVAPVPPPLQPPSASRAAASAYGAEDRIGAKDMADSEGTQQLVR